MRCETRKGRKKCREMTSISVVYRTSAIFAKLMQRHAADILESLRIYSGACDAANEMDTLFLFRITCAYMKLVLHVTPHVRSLSIKISNHQIVLRKSLGRWRERQFARTADNILGRTRDKRVGPEGHSEISGTARVLRLFGDCASDSKGLANLIPQYAPVSE